MTFDAVYLASIASEAIQNDNLNLLKVLLNFDHQLMNKIPTAFSDIEAIQEIENKLKLRVSIQQAQLKEIIQYIDDLIDKNEMNIKINLAIKERVEIDLKNYKEKKKEVEAEIINGHIKIIDEHRRRELLGEEFESFKQEITNEGEKLKLGRIIDVKHAKRVRLELKEKLRQNREKLDTVSTKKTTLGMMIRIEEQKMSKQFGTIAYQFADEWLKKNPTIEDDVDRIASLILKGCLSIETNHPLTGQNLLIQAVQAGKLDIMEYLLKLGANINCISANGENIIGEGIIHRHLPIINSLVFNHSLSIENKHLIYKDPDGNVLVHYAIRAKDYRLASYLIKNGANLFAENNEGVTPWQLAINDRPTTMDNLVYYEFIRNIVRTVLINGNETDKQNINKFRVDMLKELEQQRNYNQTVIQHNQQRAAIVRWLQDIIFGNETDLINDQEMLLQDLNYWLAFSHGENDDNYFIEKLKEVQQKYPEVVRFKEFGNRIGPIAVRAESELEYARGPIERNQQLLADAIRRREEAEQREKHLKEECQRAEQERIATEEENIRLRQELEMLKEQAAASTRTQSNNARVSAAYIKISVDTPNQTPRSRWSLFR